MNGFLFYLSLALMAAVAIILMLGLLNMMRGGSPNRSQTFMRLRVLVQFLAVAVMVALLYLLGR